MQRIAICIISGVAIGLSILWYVREGGFEPALTTLAGMTGLLGAFFGSKETDAPGPAPNADPNNGPDNGSDNESEPGRKSTDWKALFASQSEKQAAATFRQALKDRTEACIRKVEALYYDLLEKKMHSGKAFAGDDSLSRQWKTQCVTKMTLVCLYAACDARVKDLEEGVHDDDAPPPAWRVEKDVARLVRSVSQACLSLVDGDADAFRSEMNRYGLPEVQVEKIIRCAAMPAAALFVFDGRVNRGRRKAVADLIRAGASAPQDA